MAQKKPLLKVDPEAAKEEVRPLLESVHKKQQAAAATPANAPTKPEKADSKALFDNFTSKNMFGDYYKWRVMFSEDGTKDRRIALQLYPQIAAEVERISKELNVSMSDLITGAIVKLIQDYNDK